MARQLSLAPRTRADELREEAERFHRANPYVWTLFVRFSFELIEAGHRHYSARAVMHRIRWHVATQTQPNESDVPEGFKITNNHTPWYSRKFHKDFPQHKGCFRNRKQTSKRRHVEGW